MVSCGIIAAARRRSAAPPPPFSGNNVTRSFQGSGAGTSRSCTLPTKNHLGTTLAVGDTLYVIAAGGFGPNLIAGYTDRDNQTGAFWNGRVQSKVLTSGDIAAGSVTITWTGDYATWICCTALAGAVTLRQIECARVQVTQSSQAITTVGGVPVAGDYAIHWSTGRGNISLVTSSHGTAVYATSSNGEGFGRPFGETLAAGGHFSTTWTFNNSSNCQYSGVLVFAA
jgi:hypothetical protein